MPPTQHPSKERLAPLKGLDFSTPEITLSDEYMGDCLNVLIEDDEVVKRGGYDQQISGSDLTGINNNYVMAMSEYTDGSGGEHLLILTTEQLVDYIKGTPDTYSAVTGLNFTGDTDDIITLAFVGGFNTDNVYISNGKDALMVWTGSGSVTALGIDNFTELRANSIIGWQGHLVLGHTFEDEGSGVVEYPYRIRESKIGDPTQWDDNANASANFQNLIDDKRNSKVQGFEPLSNVLVCYKESAVYNITYEGSRGYFRPKMQVSDFGAISRRAWTPVLDGDVHLILSKSNLHLYDGYEFKKPAIGDRIKKNLFANLNWDYRHVSFLFSNPDRYEAYVGIPSGASTRPDRFYVWNWDANSYTIVQFEDDFMCLYYTDTFFTQKQMLAGVLADMMDMYNSNTDNGTVVDGWFRTKLDNYGNFFTSNVQHVMLDVTGTLPTVSVGKKNSLTDTLTYGSEVVVASQDKSSPKAAFGELSAIYNSIRVRDNSANTPFRVALIRENVSTAQGGK